MEQYNIFKNVSCFIRFLKTQTPNDTNYFPIPSVKSMLCLIGNILFPKTDFNKVKLKPNRLVFSCIGSCGHSEELVGNPPLALKIQSLIVDTTQIQLNALTQFLLDYIPYVM